MTPTTIATRGRRKPRRRVAVVTAFVSAMIAALPLVAVAGLPAKYRVADLKALERAFVELAQTVQPTIVAIRTYQSHGRGRTGGRELLQPFSQGSGFILGADGFIATNRHVVEDSDVISVILYNGLKYDASVVQSDVRSDLAVLKIDATHLKTVTFGDGGPLNVGQWVFAGGNPFGLANEDGRSSVTYGVISALGREMTDRLAADSDLQYYGNMIETSAAINPGNSGGPLFNVDGEVVGVVTAIETSSGVSEGHGFAIPVDKNIRRILDTLLAGKVVRYGFLGIMVRDVQPSSSPLIVDSRVYRGAELYSLSLADGPAAKAGLRPKDIVIEYDGLPIAGRDHLVRVVGFTPVGAKVSVAYLRRGVRRQTVVTLADRGNYIGPVQLRHREKKRQ